MFQLVFLNTIVELYARAEPRQRKEGEPVVLTAFGNACDFKASVSDWFESPGWASDYCVCVKSRMLNQAEFVQAPCDGSNWRDWSGHHEDHTFSVMDGLFDALQRDADSEHWIVAGLSGGCVTAVRFAEQLLAAGRIVMAVVVDSGVPGTGQSLLGDVPVSLHRYSKPQYRAGAPEFWGNGSITRHWEDRGYIVLEDECYSSPGHASFLTYNVLKECVFRFWWLHFLRQL